MTSFPYTKVYRHLHGQDQLTFHGATCVQYAERIARLVKCVGPRAILDYGSGKGAQYLRHRIHMRWGGLLPECYDPGVPYLSKRPKGPYQGIICCDVLEHIAQDDVPMILDDIFGLLDTTCPAFLFLSISCRPSKHRTLPDGRNIHLTIQPPEWWHELIASRTRIDLFVETVYDTGE